MASAIALACGSATDGFGASLTALAESGSVRVALCVACWRETHTPTASAIDASATTPAIGAMRRAGFGPLPPAVANAVSLSERRLASAMPT